MASRPNAKYDWPTYLPKMVDLYKTGMSIPKIHTEIQDPVNGFTPSLSIVYAKFRSENYSTEYTRTTLLDSARTSMGSPMLAGHGGGDPLQFATIPATAPSSKSVATEDNRPLRPDDYSYEFPGPGFNSEEIHGHISSGTQESFQQVDYSAANSVKWTGNQSQFLQDSGPAATISYRNLDWVDRNLRKDLGDNFILTDPWQAQIPYSTLNLPHTNSGFSSLPRLEFGQQQGGNNVEVPPQMFSNYDSTMTGYLEADTDQTEVNEHLAAATLQKRSREPLDDTPSPEQASVRSKRVSGPVMESVTSRITSWGKKKFNRSVSPDNRLSGSPRDSGYISGRSSLLVAIAEDTPPHPSSLLEFKGLYRVPCHCLHERSTDNMSHNSHSTDQFNIPSCDHCKYSGIHHVGWSASSMAPDQLKLELKWNRSHDITAIDAAGNSALHYAAVGGARYEQLLALIEAGVNPYQINTLGQLFLHCLHLGSDSTSSESIAVFIMYLIVLLNSLDSRGAFAALRWRDNEGMTVLDALAAQMTGGELKTETFQLVKDAGYPVEVSMQFGNFQAQAGKSKFQQQVPGTDKDTSPVGLENKFAADQKRQNKAIQTVGQATLDPSYVDPETGDNILHALSRLRLPERGSLLSHIQDFVAKDVDLNVHNRDGQSPLAAFIRERPFLGIESDETGATMSKYLDALLWKDARRRVPNKINVNMRNREGATALYYAAVRARPDSVRSLIEAGANVNARIDIDGQRISVLQATLNAKAGAILSNHDLKIHLFDNVISYLEHDGAVPTPTFMEERGICANSVTVMPM